MKKEFVYTYLGTNGTLTSTIFLENIYSVKKIELTASEGKLLTKDGIHKQQVVIIPEAELEEWYEVPA